MGNSRLFGVLMVLILIWAASCLQANETDDYGYLVDPPVFFDSFPDFPLAGMAAEIPSPGKTIPDIDISSLNSDRFRENGVDVQPQLSVDTTSIRLGALHGFNGGWAGGISIPWIRTKVSGEIGGQPASGVADGLGDILLLGKKALKKIDNRSRFVVAAGLELPTGKDDAIFGQNNAVTNAYYSNFPQRMPLSWQPGSGSVDGYLALSYGRKNGRISYVGIAAAKLHTSGDEDVEIGDIYIAGASSTYGISKRVAVALSLILRTQSDDSYPQASPPGVNQPALAGTTSHGTTLYLDPSVRYSIAGRVTVGLSVRIPVIKPDDGLVPQTRLSLIFFPTM